MKIGIFLPNATFDLPGTPEVGGIETFAFTVGEAMQKLGHEVVLYGGKPKPGHTHRDTTLTLRLSPYWETKSIPDLGTRFQRLIQRLHFGWTTRHHWLDEKFDAVLLAKPFDWPVAWWWKRFQPSLCVVMGWHGTDFFAGDYCFYGAVDQAFAVSPIVAELARQHVGTRPAVIPNPTDVDFFTPGESTTSSTDAPLRIAASGRLVGWKGFHQLVLALARLQDHNRPFHCTIAGDGPERTALQELIVDNHLAGKVSLCGRLDRDALRTLLRGSDLYVAPSIGMEAFSIAALEAASVGLPLLLSNRIGLSDYLAAEDFDSYPSDSSAVLADRLLALCDRRKDPLWTDRAARHARIRAMFSPDVVAQKIIALVQSAK